MTTGYPLPFSIYRAPKNCKGAALQIRPAWGIGALFLEMSKQIAEKKFDWSNLIEKYIEMYKCAE